MSARPSIFISGAAAGIGRATALRFLQEGWRVGAFDIDGAALEQLADDVPVNFYGNFMRGELDVTDNDSWRAALTRFAETTEGGGINVVFNNAGLLCSGDFTATAIEDHERLLRVNVQGVLAGCYHALPHLEAAADSRVGARVINMSSASAIYGQPALVSYSASKFAVRGLTEALNIEWQDKGINALDVMPLFVQTRMVEGETTPTMRRLGVRLAPEDVAETVVRMAYYRGNRVHWPVGGQTKRMLLASKLAPSSLVRAINRWLARA